MKNLNFKTSSEFNAAYQAFIDSSLSKNLSEKFRVKPFFEQYEMLRKVVLYSTYFIHAFAVATSFIGVYFFAMNIIKNMWLSGIGATLFLVLIEWLKRLTIPTAIKEWLQFKKVRVFLICAGLALASTSLLLSYFGAHTTIQVGTPTAALTDTEPLRKDYKSRIKDLQKSKREIKATMSWEGTLTPQGAKAYNEVTKQIGQIESQMNTYLNRTDDENRQIKEKHATSTDKMSSNFSAFTVIFDLLLIVAFWFLEYYDYRSFTEFASHVEENTSFEVPTESKEVPVATDNSVATDKNTFSLNIMKDLAIKQAKSNIAAFKAKLSKGEGNEGTNQQGIERWLNTINEMENLKEVADLNNECTL